MVGDVFGGIQTYKDTSFRPKGHFIFIFIFNLFFNCNDFCIVGKLYYSPIYTTLRLCKKLIFFEQLMNKPVFLKVFFLRFTS